MFTRQFYKDLLAVILCVAIGVCLVVLFNARFDNDPSINRPMGPDTTNPILGG